MSTIRFCLECRPCRAAVSYNWILQRLGIITHRSASAMRAGDRRPTWHFGAACKDDGARYIPLFILRVGARSCPFRVVYEFDAVQPCTSDLPFSVFAAQPLVARTVTLFRQQATYTRPKAQRLSKSAHRVVCTSAAV